MKKHVNIFLIFCFIFGITQHVDAFTFTRTLSIGSTGQDVFELQKILNSNTQTQVSSTGAGSPGQETFYFGELTRQAVIKFQNLYAQNILYPLGLTSGTGFVGTSTINFLNTLSNSNNITTTPSQNTPTNITQTQTPPVSQQNLVINSQEDLNNLDISQISNPSRAPLFYPYVSTSHAGKYERVGRTTRLVDQDIGIASAFKINNLNFYLGNQELRKECRNEYLCTIWINKDMEPGTYTLSANRQEMGNHQFKIIPLTINQPEIYPLEKIKLGQDVLITGKDFTNKMLVYTVFGQFETETLNNSFILNIPNTFILDEPILGGLYLENSYGLKSNILFVQYEK